MCLEIVSHLWQHFPYGIDLIPDLSHLVSCFSLPFAHLSDCSIDIVCCFIYLCLLFFHR